MLNEALPGNPPPPEAGPLLAGDRPNLVWVALSGGGTRAAAMAWKVLETLDAIAFPVREGGTVRRSTLAEQIDSISGISGGSFAAAAWCLFRDQSELFRSRFLEPNLQRRLMRRTVSRPWRLASPTFNRIHAAAEIYHHEVFGEATFASLPPRPELHIHATDLALGSRFSFTKEQFWRIGSDLARYPLGYACAASSAFPVALSPLTLRNHGRQLSTDELEELDWFYRQARQNEEDDLDWYFRRRACEHYNDKSNRYVHLADGGLVDNQGLQAVLDAFDTLGVIDRRLAWDDPHLRRLVIINVNAGTQSDSTMSRRLRPPGVKKVMVSTMVTSMDILSAKRWTRIQDHRRQIDRIQRRAARKGIPSPLAQLKTYAIEVSFRAVADEARRRACYRLPTSFSLSREELQLIDEVTPDLVLQHPEMVELQKDLAGELE